MRENSETKCKKLYKSDWASTLMKVNMNLGMWMLASKANGLFSNCKEFLNTSANIEIERSVSEIPYPINQYPKFSNLNCNFMKQAYKSVVINAANATKEKIQAKKLAGPQNAVDNFVNMICYYCHNGEFESNTSI